MFNEIDKDSPLCWTLPEKFSDIRRMIRDKWMIGGLTSVFHKHLDLTGSTDSPLAARIVPNGDLLTHIIFLDFNS